MFADGARLAGLIDESLVVTLETMAFSEVAPWRGAELFPEPADGVVWADIGIHVSDGRGRLLLAVPVALAHDLAGTMYADAPAAGDEVLADLVAEFANTATGHLLLNLGEESGSFRLDVPVTGRGTCWPEVGSGIVRRFLVQDRWPLLAVLFGGSES